MPLESKGVDIGAEIRLTLTLKNFRISRSGQNSDSLYWTRPEVDPTSKDTWGSEQLTQLLPTDSLIRFGVKWEGIWIWILLFLYVKILLVCWVGWSRYLCPHRITNLKSILLVWWVGWSRHLYPHRITNLKSGVLCKTCIRVLFPTRVNSDNCYNFWFRCFQFLSLLNRDQPHPTNGA